MKRDCLTYLLLPLVLLLFIYCCCSHCLFGLSVRSLFCFAVLCVVLLLLSSRRGRETILFHFCRILNVMSLLVLFDSSSLNHWLDSSKHVIVVFRIPYHSH